MITGIHAHIFKKRNKENLHFVAVQKIMPFEKALSAEGIIYIILFRLLICYSQKKTTKGQ